MIARWMRTVPGLGRAFRLYLMLSFTTFCLFLVLGLAGIAQDKLFASPVDTMKGLAGQVSSRLFQDMIAMEIPEMNKNNDPSGSILSQSHIAGFLVQFLTSINPDDPKSLLAREVPGIRQENAILLRKGQATSTDAYPLDYRPADGTSKSGAGSDSQKGGDDQGRGVQQGDEVKTSGADKPGQSGQSGNSAGTNGSKSANGSPGSNGVNGSNGKNGIANSQKSVFIYHSHNRESWTWVPKSKKSDDPVNDAKTNVTLLGVRMAQQLQKLGVNALNSNKDYQSTVKDYNWNYSYKYSLTTVKEAIAATPSLDYFIDIHRDSQTRSKTTVDLNGKSYAQVYFIIGHKNPNWEKNNEFATRIHDILEKRAPGVSRGIWGKSSASGHAEYNQSVSPNSILIEVGGIDNTLEECNRTIDLLAQVIAELVRDAEKVDAKPSNG